MVFVLGFLCRWALRSANSDGHASNYNGCFSQGPERGMVSKDQEKERRSASASARDEAAK